MTVSLSLLALLPLAHVLWAFSSKTTPSFYPNFREPHTQTVYIPASQKQFFVLAELLEWARDKPSNIAGPASGLCAQVL